MYRLILLLGLFPILGVTGANAFYVAGFVPDSTSAVEPPEQTGADLLADANKAGKMNECLTKAHSSLENPLAMGAVDWTAADGELLGRLPKKWLVLAEACSLVSKCEALAELPAKPLGTEATLRAKEDWERFEVLMETRIEQLKTLQRLRQGAEDPLGTAKLFEAAANYLQQAEENAKEATAEVVRITNEITLAQADDQKRKEAKTAFEEHRYKDAALAIKAIKRPVDDDRDLQKRVEFRLSAAALVTRAQGLQRKSQGDDWQEFSTDLNAWLKQWAEFPVESEDVAAYRNCDALVKVAEREIVLANLPETSDRSAWFLKAATVIEAFSTDAAVKERLAKDFRTIVEIHTEPTIEPSTDLEEAFIKGEGYRRGVFQKDVDQYKYWSSYAEMEKNRSRPTLLSADKIQIAPHQPKPIKWAAAYKEYRDTLLANVGSQEAWTEFLNAASKMHNEITEYKTNKGQTTLDLSPKIAFVTSVINAWERLKIGKYAPGRR